jgi:hypothetical protein
MDEIARQTEHSPGPLHLVWIDGEDDTLPHISIADASGEEVATIVHRTGVPVPAYKWEAAHLIVTAVNSHADLLAALRRAMGFLTDHGEHGGNCAYYAVGAKVTDCNCGLADVLKQARAALAKAGAVRGG